MATLGEQIKILRNKAGLTQKQLSEVTNIGKSALALYETNKRQPDPSNLKRLADFFGVSTDYILGRHNPLFSQRLNMLIEKEHMRIKDIAAAANVDAGTVNDWIDGRYAPDHETIVKLAVKLDIVADFLLGRDWDSRTSYFLSPPYPYAVKESPPDPLCGLTDDRKKKALEYIRLLHQDQKSEENGGGGSSGLTNTGSEGK